MEQLRENLLKNGWVRAIDVPPLTHGEMVAPPSKSNLDKWLDDFESTKLNPVIGFEENKDVNSVYIQDILAMISSEKRIPQPDTVMIDATNVRENLMKRGWYAVPVARRDAFITSVPPFNQKKNDGKPVNRMNGYCNESSLEPKNDIEKLLSMLASKKEQVNSSKCRGSVDKVNIREVLMKLGWTVQNDEPTATGGDFASETPVADEMTNLVEKWFQHFEDKRIQNVQTKPTEGHITVADEMTNLVEKWFQHFENKRIQNVQTKPTEGHITVNKDVEMLLDVLSSKKVPLPVKPSQGTMDKPKRDGYRASLLVKGWYAVPNYKLPEPASNTAVLDKPGSNLKITTVQQDIGQLNLDSTQPDYIENILNMVRMKTPLEVITNHKGAVDKIQLKRGLLSNGWYSMNESKDVDISTEQPNLLEEFSRTSAENKSNSDIPRQPEGNDCHEIKNNFDDVATESHGKSSKKTIQHGRSINNLVQQGCSVTKKSRHQITMVKVPESTSSAAKRGSITMTTTGRQSRRDKFEAQKERKTKKPTSLEKEELTGNDGEAPASVPDVSHKKKTLFRRFVRSSRKLMGRFFTCGRKEDA